MTAEAQLTKTPVAPIVHVGGSESSSAEATGSSHSSLLRNGARDPMTNGKRLMENTIKASLPITDQDSASPPAKKLRLSEEQKISTIADAVSTILECLEDDPNRQGLRKTPTRYAKALLSLTEGYELTTKQILGDAEFDEDHSEMVLIRNIDMFSLCEHHLLPFHGQCHVAYIPDGMVVGLSKIARIVDMYSRRLQVQERLTSQIADAVLEATNAKGVFVLISCTHMCMAMRGIRKVGAETTTTAARGNYQGNPELRLEVLRILGPDSKR